MIASRKSMLIFALFIASITIGTSVVFIYGMWKFGKDELNPPVDAYLNTLQSENYAGLYRQFSSERQNHVSQEAFTEFHKMIHEKLGNSYSRSMKTFNIQHNNGQGFAVATYDVEFTKGEAQLTFEFTRSGALWEIQSVSYDLPDFMN